MISTYLKCDPSQILIIRILDLIFNKINSFQSDLTDTIDKIITSLTTIQTETRTLDYGNISLKDDIYNTIKNIIVEHTLQ